MVLSVHFYFFRNIRENRTYFLNFNLLKQIKSHFSFLNVVCPKWNHEKLSKMNNFPPFLLRKIKNLRSLERD